MTPEQTIRSLNTENAELRTENATLRNRLALRNKHARRVEQAYRDALQLALWASAGVPPSRRYAAQHGITQQRWENAWALLRMARVVQRNRHWATKDAGLIERRLERTRQAAEATAEAYKARHVRDRKAV